MCKGYRITGLSAPLLALGVLLVSSQAVFAARLVRFQVSVDGKVVMTTSTGDDGHPGGDAVWRELSRLPLEEVKGFEVQPDADDELRATLKGHIVIESSYAGRAEVQQLKLVKESKLAPWQIEPAEVERTLKSRHKLFAFAVTDDGHRVFYTQTAFRKGPQQDSPANVWRELKRTELRTYERLNFGPGSDDLLRLSIEGKIVVELKYNNQNWVRAEISKVKLVRANPKALWMIDPAEVDRAFESVQKSTD